MPHIPEVIPMSDLRRGTTDLLKRVRASREPMVVTHRGRAAAVLLSVEEYQRRERDVEILRILAEGEREIAAGHGHDLDDVLVEADGLLRSTQP